MLAGSYLQYMGAPTTWLFLAPVAMLGSLMPDIDHPDSLVKKNVVVKVLSFPLILLGHRTWSHSLLILAAIYWLWMAVPDFFELSVLAFAIGYISHLVGDWMTSEGIPLLFPFPINFRSPFYFQSGSLIEYPVAITPLVISAYLFATANNYI
ncbi:MAG: hypothetical protein GW882_00040 [Thiomicrospira sp.]|nr:hypothetical protein [Thiomicrospira sp.]NCN67723.1 hypothetical protein [Thiomicrospira sp.]NCO80541.1 hypothetical protein [Thiomicrospira sp.]